MFGLARNEVDGECGRELASRSQVIRQGSPFLAIFYGIFYLSVESSRTFIFAIQGEAVRQVQIIPVGRIIRCGNERGVWLQVYISYANEIGEGNGFACCNLSVFPAPAHTAVIVTVFNHPVGALVIIANHA